MYNLGTNLLIITVILAPAIILFGMILFSGPPKNMTEQENDQHTNPE